MRLDIYLVQNEIFSSREQAKFNIAKGTVMVNGKLATKPSQPITQTDSITLTSKNAIPFASRGGLKLEKALQAFSIDCNNKVALDVGASTGGFTDCLLQHGASHVCAIDVGTNQMAETLKTNPKVVSIENINIKDLKPEQLDPNIFDLIVADLSFVSLTKVLDYFPKFLASNGYVITLIKPQFEVGPSQINRGGVVKNPKAHMQAIESIAIFAQKINLHLWQLTYAPIHQSTKNIEYLALFSHNPQPLPNIPNTVREAFCVKSKP